MSSGMYNQEQKTLESFFLISPFAPVSSAVFAFVFKGLL